jgi:hypothetical protein
LAIADISRGACNYDEKEASARPGTWGAASRLSCKHAAHIWVTNHPWVAIVPIVQAANIWLQAKSNEYVGYNSSRVSSFYKQTVEELDDKHTCTTLMPF